MNLHFRAPGASCLVAAAAVLLAACGGGGNESGPADQIVTSQSEVTATGAPDQCATGIGPKVFVYGGRPPYTVANSYPAGIQLDTTYVANSGDGFSITFINGACMQTMPLTIQDSMGRLATVKVTNEKGT